MQNITKSINCKTLKELLEVIEKVSKKKEIKTYNFNGNKNNENTTEYYSISWSEEEEL